MKNLKINIPEDIGNSVYANFCGNYDNNLRQIEKKLNIKIIRQNYLLTLSGAQNKLEIAQSAILKLLTKANKNLSAEFINTTIMECEMNKQLAKNKLRKNSDKPEKLNDTIVTTDNNLTSASFAIGRKTINARTINQLKYIRSINQEDLVFGVGPAGTGKTYLAVAGAVSALENSLVQRIVLTRPALEAGERLGFLPGTLAEKVDPYLRPVYDALFDTLGVEKFHRYMNDGIIEIAPLAFMRGRTLNESFIILDEAQNTTPEQMKMFLTRIGFGSKTVVNGDLTQTDLPPNKISGLNQAINVLKKIAGIDFVYFDHNDVVRHPLVARIVKAYGNV